MKLWATVDCNQSTFLALSKVAASGRFSTERQADGQVVLSTEEILSGGWPSDNASLGRTWSQARRWLAQLAGALRLSSFNDIEPIELKNLFYENAEGKRVPFPITATMQVFVEMGGGMLPEDQSQQLLAVADRDGLVALVLAQWEHTPTWVALYKVYELIRADLGGVPDELGGVTKGTMNRFTASANSTAPDARHAVGNPHPRMTLTEASHVVRQWTMAWLQTKGT